MLHYDLPVYRPPSEGNNLILQATLGCSHNRCTFCSMYKSKTFRARSREEVFADIALAAEEQPDTRRVFLADGDALALPPDDLAAILDELAVRFVRLERVSCYATPLDLNRKSPEELTLLRKKGLTLLYFGVESGSADILARIRKGANPDKIASALGLAHDSGIAVSATVILGLGGRRLWRDHIEGTAALINRAPPDFLSTLQLMLSPEEAGTFVSRFERDGTPFEPQDDLGVLEELHLLLSRLNPPRPVVFRSNHASNCLPLAGTLPQDRDGLVAIVADARDGAAALRPEFLRGL
ncbi:MAG: radical SAM protein [Alphaproteobacteria bacterium]|nr:radical SAM protein [Alphaproteobacteria bacterium]